MPRQVRGLQGSIEFKGVQSTASLERGDQGHHWGLQGLLPYPLCSATNIISSETPSSGVSVKWDNSGFMIIP